MAAHNRHDYRKIVRRIYLLLPFTLLKQKLAWRLRKPPSGLPDFLGIGVQKAGTTWLYDQLQLQPEVQLARVKEVHYFDWFFHRPLKWYLSQFGEAKGKVRGEITPGYSIIERGRIKFLKRIKHDLRLILILRDPRYRAWSAARFHYGTVLGRDLKDVSAQQYIDYLRQSWVKQRGDYTTIIQNWKSVFPEDQLLILYNEDIASDPYEELCRVCAFLGTAVPVKNDRLSERPNKSKEAGIPSEVARYLENQYTADVLQLEGLLNRKLDAWRVQISD